MLGTQYMMLYFTAHTFTLFHTQSESCQATVQVEVLLVIRNLSYVGDLVIEYTRNKAQLSTPLKP